MADSFSKQALTFFQGCELASSATGGTPEPGAPCYLFVQDEAGRLHKNCEKCPYYAELSAQEGVSTRDIPTGLVVELKGLIKEAHLPALRSALEGFPARKKPQLLLDCSRMLSLPQQALGMILRAFKTAREKQQDIFLVGVQPVFRALLEELRLSRVLPQVAAVEEAEALLRKREEEARTGEARAREEKKQKLISEAQSVRCWEFFKGQNPKNVTECSECFYKASGSKRPCWIIQGNIDGVTFEYSDEMCASCPYFLKFNPEGNLEVNW